MSKDDLVGWRVMACNYLPKTPKSKARILSLVSLMTKETFLPKFKGEYFEGDDRGFYVGTTERFCREYYCALIDETPTFRNVLFRLVIKRSDVITGLEDWNGSFIGSEARVQRAKIDKIIVL
jgi:hypothetical protein